MSIWLNPFLIKSFHAPADIAYMEKARNIPTKFFALKKGLLINSALADTINTTYSKEHPNAQHRPIIINPRILISDNQIFITNSAINTATQDSAATCTRLFSKNATITAATNPTSAVIGFEVA